MVLRWDLKRQRDEASNDSEFINGMSDPKFDSRILSYYGTDQKQNFLFIKIKRRANKPSELVFFLRLEDGCTYELLNHPNLVIGDIGNSTWSAAGLKISVLQSSRRTRILFNGLLRKGNRTDIDNNCDDDVQHVRLNCIFIASTKPYTQEEYWSPNLLTETLAHNSWHKSKWQEFSKDFSTDQVDQYGSLMAEVTFEDSSRKQLYLRGMRQFQWGKFDANYFNRNICIVASDTLGVAFYVKSSNINDGVKNMQLGHVKDANDDLHAIESLTFDADQLMERYNGGLNDYEFRFTAGKRTYVGVVEFRRDTLRILYGGYPWDSQYTYCQFDLTLDGFPGAGMIEIWQPYNGTCPDNLIVGPKTSIKLNKTIDDKQVLTLLFEDERCRAENLVGGKGASLAELTAIRATEFTVPKGFCVTVNALEEHVEVQESLMDKIDELVQICRGGEDETVKMHCEILVAEFEPTTVAESVRDAISETLGEFESRNGDGGKYAVRSSAVGEDSEETSAAGQNSTFLGVARPDVVGSVVHCWASLYSYRSVQYRRDNGLPIKASMGVCVQRIVDAEAAGVMFTRDHATGNPQKIIISSNYGLGESVVSSTADPDDIIVRRDRTDSLSIVSSTIGKKWQKVVVNHDEGGTVRSNVCEDDKSRLSISEEVVLKLAGIGVMLDQLYNTPRDIEWAVSEGQIYLLQCRPVTALDAWTDFELAHELGSGVPSDSDILTLANVGEGLPAVVTPLTQSIVIRGCNLATESGYARRLISDTCKKHLFVVNSKCFLNYATFLRYAKGEVTLGSKLAEIVVCGRSIVTPEINEIILKRNGGPMSRLTELKLLSEIIANFFYKPRMIVEAQHIVGHCKTTWEAMQSLTSSEALYERLVEMYREFIKLSLLHIHTTQFSVCAQVFVLSTLAEDADELSAEHYSDIAMLLGSCRDVVSAQVPVALKEITRTIERSGLSETFKNVEPSKALPWLLTHCPKAYEQVQKFIEIHGHRGNEEFELITETWGMKPEKFLSTVQSMLNSTTDDSTKANELSPRETVAQLKTPRKWSTRWIISTLLSSMRRTISEREHTKFLLAKLVHIMRLGYRKLGEILVQEGRLIERELVFFLTHEELAQFVSEPFPSLMRKAVRRRRFRPTLQRNRYNNISYGLPKPIEVPKSSASIGGVRLQGIVVSNGVATGRAYVAFSFDEGAKIQKDDILITHATDIGWTVHYSKVAGIVTELGGLASHGVVVARECHIPCIVGVDNATAIFKTGDIVTLDGYAGTIEVVDQARAETS